MFENEMRELNAGSWAEPSYIACPCRHGWFLSDLDTWHRCPFHGRDVPHPEDEQAQFDYAAHQIRMLRQDWRLAQERSGLSRAAFRRCVSVAVRHLQAPTPTEWVTAAWAISDEMRATELATRAHAQGYSCRLEAAWAAEADVERRARDAHMDPDDYAPRGSPQRHDADSWCW